MSDTPLLELRGVTKSFGSVQALTDVDFEVRNGEVMALVGDNGAGKSTLIKCVAGIHPMDEGQMLFDGEEVAIHGPKDAAKLGIEVVYQDLALCDNLDVVQNMYLGREARSRFQILREPPMEAKARETLASLRVTTIGSIRQAVATLSGGQRQSVAVARAVMWNSRLVILDEPTAALGVAQTEQVLALVNRLAEQGLAVVLISHNLHDVFETATRIAVLRLGRNVGVYERAKTTQQEVVEAITAGRPTKVSGIAQHRFGGAGVTAAASVRRDRDRRRSIRSRSASWDNVRTGNLGSAPVIVALALIVLVFSQTAQNFFTPANLHEHHHADGGHLPDRLRRGVRPADRGDRPVGRVRQRRCRCRRRRDAAADRRGPPVVPLPSSWRCSRPTLIGAFQGSVVALIGVPSFVVTLAGYEIWQGVILRYDHPGRDRDPGQQDQRFLELPLQRGSPGGSWPESSPCSTSAGCSGPRSRAGGTGSRSATRSCSCSR